MRIEKINQQLQSGKILNQQSDSTTDTYSADYINNNLSGGSGGDGIPIGAIISFSSTTIPEGYLVCNGATLQINEYRTLFDVISNVYGGDGITTFKLPDMRDKFIFGLNEGVIGETGGEENHTLTVAEIPAHNHTYNKPNSATDSHTLTINEMPSHTHQLRVDQTQGGSNAGAKGSWGTAYTGVDNNMVKSTGGSQGHTHNIGTTSTTTGNTGTGQAHNNMPPFITQIFIIKAFNNNGEVPTGSQILNSLSYSTTDTYSANYINQYSGDNIPVGTEVEYDGETVPDGWQEVEDDNPVTYESKGTTVKYDNGIVMCMGVLDTGAKAFTTAYGSVYYDGTSHTITFPDAFVLLNQSLISVSCTSNIPRRIRRS